MNSVYLSSINLCAVSFSVFIWLFVFLYALSGEVCTHNGVGMVLVVVKPYVHHINDTHTSLCESN